MKLSTILILVVIAIAGSILITSVGDASQYVTFNDALEMSKSGNTNKVHVVGSLPKTKSGDVVGINYNPLQNPNLMSFQLTDEKGFTQKVVTYEPPASMQDFKRSEKVVIIGHYEKDYFLASQILMKCPSKYEDNTLEGQNLSQYKKAN